MKITKKISSPVIAALLVFILGSTATYLTWSSSQDRTRQKSNSELEEQSKTFVSSLQTRATAIEEILRGTISLSTNDDFSAAKFSEYIDSLDISERYPSVDSLGYVKTVQAAELPAFVEKMRNEVSPNYTIFPPGSRGQYSPIAYLKLVNDKSESNSIMGYDIQTDANFGKLLNEAKNTGEPTLSKVLALTEPDTNVYEPGVALIAPAYVASDTSKSSPTGFLFATLRVRTFVQTVLDKSNKDVNVTLYDGEKADESKLLFGVHRENSETSTIRTFKIAGRTWTVLVNDNSVTNTSDKNQSGLLMLLGIILSALVASFLLYIIKSKAREVELQKQLEIESAKDGLLSLASHQLRTPATSVKQYIGMVREGYVGEITPEQEEMLSKANESNERQLAIVNQILSLSQLESKTPTLNKRPIDLVNLVNDVVRDEAFVLNSKKVSVKSESDQIPVVVDNSYLRMVIENLLTNASKYSRDGANIDIRLFEDDEYAYVEVKDSGIGIDPKDFEDLFVLFHRVDNELSLNVSGTGIGLYVSKLIVDLHSGKIDVKSKPGEGSVFTVSLPKNIEDGTDNG